MAYEIHLQHQAEKRRSQMAEDGDLSELFEALEMEDDGKERSVKLLF